MGVDNVSIHQASREDAAVVVEMVHHLLKELGGFSTQEPEQTVALCEELLDGERYAALLAVGSQGETLGVLTLAECHALYVSGRLGWIQELYVVPHARSSQVGQALILAAIAYGQARGWRRLEVNTPNASEWPRTVAFYRREGFAGESFHLRMPL